MASEKIFRSISLKEVESHNTEQSAWVIIHGEVFDVTMFLQLHPGGRQMLLDYCGKDASEVFDLYHSPAVMEKYRAKFKIGNLEGWSRPEKLKPEGTFGDLISFGDPLWYQRLNSPYYKQTHRDFRARIRHFVETIIVPTFNDWKDANEPPRDIYAKMGQEGFLACMVGPPFPAEYVDPGTPHPADFDYFHELILYDELSRLGSSSAVAALSNGPAIAISAVWRFGSPEQKRKWLPDILMGRKFCALAISEPNAGSDVAGLKTTATRVPGAGGFQVCGNKKWITNGTYADLFVAAVLTGVEGGHAGMSLMLIPRDAQGFSVRKLRVPGSNLSGTAYLDFDRTPVPEENVVGTEGDGWKYVMYNFNHERMYVATIALRLSRVCLEESIKYALKRKTFGKYLADTQAIRMKIAAMARRIEAAWSWLESIVYSMCTMSHREASLRLGDVLALVKVESSKVYEYCARETTMVFGGNALMHGGPGDKIVDAVAQVKGYQIPAGSEDVLDDFGARTIFKLTKMMAKL